MDCAIFGLTLSASHYYGVSLGLQASGAHPERVVRLREFFEHYRSGDEYDRNAITHG